MHYYWVSTIKMYSSLSNHAILCQWHYFIPKFKVLASTPHKWNLWNVNHLKLLKYPPKLVISTLIYPPPPQPPTPNPFKIRISSVSILNAGNTISILGRFNEKIKHSSYLKIILNRHIVTNSALRHLVNSANPMLPWYFKKLIS